MRRPPRPRAEGLFSRGTLGVALAQGLSILAACLGVFLLGRRDHSPDAARALTFATLVIAFLVVILVNRSWTRSALSMLCDPNKGLRWVLLGVTGFLIVALPVPFARRLFRFAPLHADDLALSLRAGFVCVLWLEVVKLRSGRSDAERPPGQRDVACLRGRARGIDTARRPAVRAAAAGFGSARWVGNEKGQPA